MGVTVNSRAKRIDVTSAAQFMVALAAVLKV